MRIALLGVLALAACGDGEAARKSAENDRLIFYVQDQVKARLRDPESAVFTHVRVAHTAGVPAVCGEVNSRNGLGGMTGPQRFIGGGMTRLEEEFAPGEFELSWAQLC